MNEAVKRFIDEKYEEIKTISENEDKTILLMKDRESEEMYLCKKINRVCDVYKKLKEIKNIYLPKIYYVAYDENETVVIEEYIQGENFREILEKDKMIPEENGVNIFKMLCSALMSIHSKKVIHRDIKPENIMYTSDAVIKLIDFDAARTKKDKTNTDTVPMGTKGYAAPEQYGFSQTGIYSDIYSLGVMMKEIFGGNNYIGKYSKIIQKCTMFDPNKRYKSAFSLKFAILIREKRKYAFPIFLLCLFIYIFMNIIGYPAMADDLRRAFSAIEGNEIIHTAAHQKNAELKPYNYDVSDVNFAEKTAALSNDRKCYCAMEKHENYIEFIIWKMESETGVDPQTDKKLIKGKADFVNESKAIYYSEADNYEIDFMRYGDFLVISNNAYSSNINQEYDYTGVYQIVFEG